MNQPSTRLAVTEALLDLAEKDSQVVFVTSDSLGVIKAQPFKEKYPNRVVEMGISEQAAMAAAGGMASCGLKPVYVSYAVFASMRACEQFRTMVAYPGLNVTVVGANGGMASGEREGVSHQGIEDLGILRSIPGITVISPSDAGQVRDAIKAAVEIPGPVYVRTGSGREPLFWQNGEKFEFNTPRTFFEKGKDVVLFCHGFVLPNVQEACNRLDKEGIGVRAVEVATIKPLNNEVILGHLKDCSFAVAVEDHNVIGGLGSAICELASENHPVPILRVGIKDCFPESGTPEELYGKYRLSADDIYLVVKDGLARFVS
jgi:transketolase